MKKLSLLVAGGAMLLASACNDSPKADAAATGDSVQTNTASATAETQNVDVAASKIEWEGTKAIGDGHKGTIAIKDGTLSLENGAVKSGKFTIDMNGITPTDQKDTAGNNKLKGHLSSADFFDVTKFPTATFEIASVTNGVDTTNLIYKDATHTVTGNLTMKGITKSITFPAKIDVTADKTVAHADFKIDRTNWGVSYGSDESAKDKMINKDIHFIVHIEAKK